LTVFKIHTHKFIISLSNHMYKNLQKRNQTAFGSHHTFMGIFVLNL